MYEFLRIYSTYWLATELATEILWPTVAGGSEFKSNYDAAPESRS